MNTNLKFKVLQYLNHKKPPSGLTFVEILIVVIIMGLGTFIIPSFFSKGCACSKQSEARTYTGTINKGEQAYYTEKNEFSPTIADLGIGIRTASVNYNYHVKVINNGNKSVAIGYSTLTAKGAGRKNYVGYVSLIPSKDNPTEINSDAILCEQKTAGDPASLDIEWKPGIEAPKCNKDQVQVGGTN
jgi:type IV pilus assembly protein PilA